MAVRGALAKKDMLSRLLSIVQEKGEKLDFNDGNVAVNVFDGVMAGSDTTAVALTGQFYHIFNDRRVYDKLVHEVRDAFATGKLFHPIHCTDQIKLDYWQVCL